MCTAYSTDNELPNRAKPESERELENATHPKTETKPPNKALPLLTLNVGPPTQKGALAEKHGPAIITPFKTD